MIDVAVVGSLHLDILVSAPRLPVRDETLMGESWQYKCGGKGGNQAVAAARFGARTAFGGQTGRDDFGKQLRANLAGSGIDISCVDCDPSQRSGMSVAISEKGGEYSAVVVSGANRTVDADAIGDRWAALWSCRVLLLQNEMPERVNLVAAREARGRGGRVILNAAPARPIASELLDLTDVLIVNRVEAAMLSGKDDADGALAALHRPSLDVVVTLGAAGLKLMRHDGTIQDIPAHKVKAVSSHGAGDFFCGALAARLVEGEDLIAAARFARTAAALFVATPAECQDQIDVQAVLACASGQISRHASQHRQP
jgi:ribokinase